MRRLIPERILHWALIAAGMMLCPGETRPQDRPARDYDWTRADRIDLAGFFDNMEGTVLLLDEAQHHGRVYNLDRARMRFPPASTFKIPTSLVALETGVVDDAEFALPWDKAAAPPEDWWPRAWRREQTLRSAFQQSVFWFYQELARRIGDARMQEYLERFDYGNRDTSGGIDRFWLTGGLRISPIEQVEFLRRFYHSGLGVSDRATSIVKSILVLEDTPQYRISGKTGTAEITSTRELGWLVGFVEKPDTVCYYALNMEGEQVWEQWPPAKRIQLIKTILAHLGVMTAEDGS